MRAAISQERGCNADNYEDYDYNYDEEGNRSWAARGVGAEAEAGWFVTG